MAFWIGRAAQYRPARLSMAATSRKRLHSAQQRRRVDLCRASASKLSGASTMINENFVVCEPQFRVRSGRHLPWMACWRGRLTRHARRITDQRRDPAHRRRPTARPSPRHAGQPAVIPLRWPPTPCWPCTAARCNPTACGGHERQQRLLGQGSSQPARRAAARHRQRRPDP